MDVDEVTDLRVVPSVVALIDVRSEPATGRTDTARPARPSAVCTTCTAFDDPVPR